MTHILIVISILITCVTSAVIVKTYYPGTVLEKEVEEIAEEVIKEETGLNIDL